MELIHLLLNQKRNAYLYPSNSWISFEFIIIFLRECHNPSNTKSQCFKTEMNGLWFGYFEWFNFLCRDYSVKSSVKRLILVCKMRLALHTFYVKQQISFKMLIFISGIKALHVTKIIEAKINPFQFDWHFFYSFYFAHWLLLRKWVFFSSFFAFSF